MAYRLPRIDPARLGDGVLAKMFPPTKEHFIDDAVLSMYNMGRRIANDPHWGEVYVTDVLGCNFRCAHCWVSDYALNGDVKSSFAGRKAELFPAPFRGKNTHGADAVFDYLARKGKNMERKVFAFTGGETTFYRGGLKRVAERAQLQEEDVQIGIDTNGWLIARHDGYLDAWEGLQEVMNLYVSVKGATPSEFHQFTGVGQEHFDAMFITIERLLKRGFKTIPGGVVLNTIGYASKPEEAAENLHRKLASIHPDLPRLTSYHKISTMVHDKKALSERMKNRGYVHTQPSRMEEVLEREFERLGTPLLDAQPGSERVPGMVRKDQLIRQIISDLSVAKGRRAYGD